MTSPLRFVSLIALTAALAGCSWFSSDPTYTDKEHEKTYKNGSVLSDEGGVNILGGPDKPAGSETGLGVNGFLWRATLDTISFMPIVSADPFGGVILTDWYSAPATPNERIKLNIFIRDRELRADGVKVTVFRQTRSTSSGAWSEAPVAAATASGLESAILTRARQIRVAQKQFN
jgi:hypothetical protein